MRGEPSRGRTARAVGRRVRRDVVRRSDGREGAYVRRNALATACACARRSAASCSASSRRTPATTAAACTSARTPGSTTVAARARQARRRLRCRSRAPAVSTPVLVEAKAHVDQFGPAPCGATGEMSIAKIRAAFDSARQHLGSSASTDTWMGGYYQLANRLTWALWPLSPSRSRRYAAGGPSVRDAQKQRGTARRTPAGATGAGPSPRLLPHPLRVSDGRPQASSSPRIELDLGWSRMRCSSGKSPQENRSGSSRQARAGSRPRCGRSPMAGELVERGGGCPPPRQRVASRTIVAAHPEVAEPATPNAACAWCAASRSSSLVAGMFGRSSANRTARRPCRRDRAARA